MVRVWPVCTSLKGDASKSDVIGKPGVAGEAWTDAWPRRRRVGEVVVVAIVVEGEAAELMVVVERYSEVGRVLQQASPSREVYVRL
jgi:hypothetical protein